MVRATAMQAFFFPRLDAIFQNFVDKPLFLVRAIAQAASHNATLVCEFPFKLFVLFFYRRSRGYQVPNLPMKIGDRLMEIDPYGHQSQQ